MTWFRFNGFFSDPVSRNTPARRGKTIAPHPKVQEAPGPRGPVLSYEGPLLIVGGGTVDPNLLREIAGAMSGIVGADSGADTIIEAGLVPDAVIGDMDSIAGRGTLPSATQVIELAEQETTDFEKTLYSTKATLTIALGMTGGRFDHTLAALHAVARAAPKRRVILVDEHDLALGVAGSLRLEVGAGSRVSVYPLGRTLFKRSQGLLYPLDGLEMEQGKMIGTSNRAVEDVIDIEVAGGQQSPWLLVMAREMLSRFL